MSIYSQNKLLKQTFVITVSARTASCNVSDGFSVMELLCAFCVFRINCNVTTPTREKM